MKVVTKYVANDGKEFESEELCLAHEKATETALNAMKIIQSNCQSFYKDKEICEGCPFAFDDMSFGGCILQDGYPFEWSMPE